MTMTKRQMNVGINLSGFHLPVIKAVPSKFHLPAKTAPLWASTLFSTRPFLETKWNFPAESREKCKKKKKKGGLSKYYNCTFYMKSIYQPTQISISTKICVK